MRHVGAESQEARDWVAKASIVVFDDYVTECPGYTGKVMLVVWAPGPSLYEAFVFLKGQITHLKQDPSCHRLHVENKL